jgi:hypothetical protein
MSPRSFEGGCLCNRIRYRIDGEPIDAGYCHCRMCQRASAAPVVAWGTWPAHAFEIRSGQPTLFQSSNKGRRGFCAACGTPLTFVSADAPDLLDVTLASLDHPAELQPEFHGWYASRIPWFEVDDALPRHLEGGPDAAG